MCVKRKHSAERVKAVHEALKKVEGNRAEAAKLLGISIPTVYKIISNTPELTAIWGRSRAVFPGEIPSSADLPLKPVDPAALDKAAIDRFTQDFGPLGFSPEDIQMAASMVNFHRRNVAAVLDLTNGSMSATSMRVMRMIEKLYERIGDGFYSHPDPELNIREEKMCRDSLARLVDLQIKMAKSTQDAAAIKAKISELEAKSKAGGRISGKPGFAPLQAAPQQYNINAGAVVITPSNEPSQSAQPGEDPAAPVVPGD